jgi:tRNA-Thr(GGU) m(6)t(6)A37 methyltransferase TsaA
MHAEPLEFGPLSAWTGRAFRATPIGVVRRSDGVSETTQESFLDPAVPSEIVIDERWTPDLAGIEEVSHLVVLFWFDRARRRHEPGKLMRPEGRADMPEIGFFATRTPHRPNPIMICCPRLLRRDGNRLLVTGLDAWDGTPELDVKGYLPRDEHRPDATIPNWQTRLNAIHARERVPEGE